MHKEGEGVRGVNIGSHANFKRLDNKNAKK
jgi:hypothetical protein